MDLPADYAVRASTQDDLDAVAGVLIAGDLHDTGQSILDADFLQDQWSRAGFDLATDAWVVAHHGDAIVGYRQAMREEPTVVNPGGSSAPGGTRDGASARGYWPGSSSGRPSCWSGFGPPASGTPSTPVTVPQRRCWRPMAYGRSVTFWHMQLDFATGFEPAPPPAGIKIGGIDPRVHLPAVHAVLEEAFADHWGHHREPLDRWAAEQTGSPSYDLTLWLLATEAGSWWVPDRQRRGRPRLGE